ncbi:MAG: hypothetical protein HDS35_05430 [Bacteroides sp.]|nr:hypothetical protein [Bacteroides sp.]
MKKEKRSILDFLKGLFYKETGGNADSLTAPDEATVDRLLQRALGERPEAVQRDVSGEYAEKGDSEGKDSDNADERQEKDSDSRKNDDSKRRESCPYATKRAIVESIDEIKRFAEEHKLAASVLRSLLSLLGEIALGALKGKVSRQILDALLKALNYELAVEEAFKKGCDNGRNEFLEERYPAADDGLPHINGTIRCADTTSIFDVAAEARR